MKKIKLKVGAVIFDMDGVITNSMPDHYASWKKVLNKEGINITRHEVYLREGQPGDQTIKELFKLHNLRYSISIGERILSNKEDLFKNVIKTRFISGAKNLLHRLYSNNFKLALVTGTARHEMLKILPKHLYDMFSVVVTGTDVTKGKPHPEPFLKAIKKLNLNSTDCVVVENAPFGIRSAKNAGLKCIAIETSLPRKYLKEADYVFNSIKGLNENIRFISINNK